MTTPFPKRIVEGDDAAARILRAEIERKDEGAPPDFAALRARRSRRHARTQRTLVAALALGAFALVLVSRSRPPEFSITAETTHGPSHSGALALGTLPTTAPSAATAAAPRVESALRAAAPSNPRSALPSPATAKRPLPTPEPGPAQAATPSAGDCKALVQVSQYEAAARCYGDQAERSSGVGAEVAWMERARIESRALGRPSDALVTLAAYERRFPDGTLSTEARLTSIELLAAVGRREEALVAIGEATPRVPERAGALHLLGARLALETNSCALAEQHLQAAERARASADRIAALRVSSKCFAGPEAGTP